MINIVVDATNLLWVIFSIGILLPGLHEFFSPYTSATISTLLYFGKLRKSSRTYGVWEKWFYLPKRLFWIFYFVGVISTLLGIFLLTLPIFSNYFDQKLLKLIGLFAYFIHVLRRLYETLFVSIFSKNSKMNVLHFLLGIFFYMMVVVSQLAPVQRSTRVFDQELQNTNDISVSSLLIISLFLFLQHLQHLCFCQLASIRRSENGIVNSEFYGIPHGYLFNFVSSPHYTIEIGLYIILVIYYKYSLSMVLCCLFVMINQTISAILMHRWYIRKYGNEYLGDRKALIPFLF